MNTVFAHAYLLRTTPFRDSDLVVSLLTPELGRLSALARGARNSRKRFGGALDYFCLLRAELRPARSGMAKLLGVELVHSHETVGADVDRYMAGSHLLEVSRLSTREGDPSTDAFALLWATLEALDEGGDLASLVRIFQLRTIANLGYAPTELACAGCGSGLERNSAHFEDAGLLCPPCGAGRGVPLSPGAVRVLIAAATIPYERFPTLKISPAQEEEIGPVVEAALTRALGAQPRSLAQLHEMMNP